ncbi:hypothetical protein AAG570_009348 [Ranatra chinensis]|uniref:Uncharacterized protein n=1 Tax=Ranatra chinensis TaxID=642074 RepID=A0ABD0YZQ6_9HEMI
MPRELQEQDVLPRNILEVLPRTVTVPLAQGGRSVEGRGFLRKIVLPFLLGLKFKAVVVIPLALAFIALKTWKALTLGLLSVVLSASMILFKLSRPKVVNYELYYPPPPPPPTAHHHIIADPSGPPIGAFAFDHHRHHRQARDQTPPDHLAYSAYAPHTIS